MREERYGMEQYSSRFGGVTKVTRIAVCLGGLRVHCVPSLALGDHSPDPRPPPAARTATLSFFECIKATSRSMALCAVLTSQLTDLC
jgi:hypothetical protein